MRCAWKELKAIIPPWIERQLNGADQDKLNELRLRAGQAPQRIRGQECSALTGTVKPDDLEYVLQRASHFSPWAAHTLSQGFLTAPGGHRIGVCGQSVIKDGLVSGFQHVSSVSVRVARDFPDLCSPGDYGGGSVLIIGSPGWGKTTLLRSLIRCISNEGTKVAVVDERGELFPADAFDRGRCTDVLTGCSKAAGVEMLLRTMTPDVIAVDEITSARDTDALISAGWCGVKVIATAHGASSADLLRRQVYRPIVESGLFDELLVLRPDRSWIGERMVR